MMEDWKNGMLEDRHGGKAPCSQHLVVSGFHSSSIPIGLCKPS